MKLVRPVMSACCQPPTVLPCRPWLLCCSWSLKLQFCSVIPYQFVRLLCCAIDIDRSAAGSWSTVTPFVFLCMYFATYLRCCSFLVVTETVPGWRHSCFLESPYACPLSPLEHPFDSGMFADRVARAGNFLRPGSWFCCGTLFAVRASWVSAE